MILVLFFLSGFTALLYEVVWERLLHVVFGLSTYAVTVVTAAFMLGLALGYMAGQSAACPAITLCRVWPGRRIDRRLRPDFSLSAENDRRGLCSLRRQFCAANRSHPARPVAARNTDGPHPAHLARQLAQEGRTGRRIGLLYAINTTGSVLGAFFAGVFFIRTYGVFQTTLIATAINAAICLVALIQPRRPVKQADHSAEQTERTGQTSSLPVRLLFFPFITGFTGLALQIIWVRTLICVVSNNTYSFSVVLAGILMGLALGAWLYAACGRHAQASRPRRWCFCSFRLLGRAQFSFR